MNQHIEVSHAYAGHALVFSVLGLLQFGFAPNWDDQTGRDKIAEALTASNTIWLTHLANESKAIQKGVEILREMGPEEGRDNWQELTGVTLCKFLEEHGGRDGLFAAGRELLKRAHGNTVEALHEYARQKYEQDGTADVQDASGIRVVEIDMSGDLEEQIAKSNINPVVADMLRSMNATKQ